MSMKKTLLSSIHRVEGTYQSCHHRAQDTKVAVVAVLPLNCTTNLISVYDLHLFICAVSSACL